MPLPEYVLIKQRRNIVRVLQIGKSWSFAIIPFHLGAMR